KGFFLGGVGTGQDTAILSAFFTQDTGQSTSINTSNGHRAVFFEVLIQRLLAAPVTGQQRQIANDQAGSPDTIGLGVFRRGAGVADMGISQGDDLLCVGGIGEDFLIAGHGGVEHDLADGLPIGTDGFTAKNAAISKCKYGWRTQETSRRSGWRKRRL